MGTMRTNRLAGETSPYLLQHAHNPVDWYPWGAEALERARATDRPIFLSVGYAACHWCHVMERESFEDRATAELLNGGFVPVKVDREERPDVDAIYMAAVQAMTGQGGWPMSAFLTPEGRPFYGGTYFPARRVLAIPSFSDVLRAVADAWRERRDELEAMAARLADVLARAGEDEAPRIAAVVAPEASTAPETSVASALDPGIAGRAEGALVASADAVNGGWGTAPKFPQPSIVEFLLARAAAGEDGRALAVANRALRAMAAGGIHDHVGGGFHRYSTDARWHVPHFEKMLYDNAQLARAFLHAYEVTGDALHARVAARTAAYLRREMGTPEGLFAASEDADTGGVEGATYTWTPDEVDAVLGPDAALFRDAFGVTMHGDVDGRSVLGRVADDEALAARHGIGVDEVARRLDDALDRLHEARGRRAQPARDDKALAGWNGLAIAALADVGRVLGSDADLAAAGRAAEAALALLRCTDGRLARAWRAGRTSGPGMLEDHALLADGLLALYRATFDERWFVAARDLAEIVLARFADPAGGFWDTADDHERLIARPRSIEDNAVPSGGAVIASVLLRLAALTGEVRYRATAEAALERVAPVAARYPVAFAAWLQALDLAAHPIAEVAIVGDPSDPATRALLAVATRGLQPRRVVALSADPAGSRIELLQSRFALHGLPTAFVCRDFACRQPVTEPEALAAQLAG